MYCKECGSEIINHAEACSNCGALLAQKISAGIDQPSTLVNLVACCFPIVGLILYFVWKDDKPLSAKSVGKWALIGFGISVLLYVLSIVLGIFAETILYF